MVIISGVPIFRIFTVTLLHMKTQTVFAIFVSLMGPMLPEVLLSEFILSSQYQIKSAM